MKPPSPRNPADVAQKDLVAELKLNPLKMKQIRGEHLATADWYAHGAGGQIWIRPEGQRKLRIWADVRKDAAHVAHHFVKGIVLEALPHPEWLSIKVQNGNGDWIKAPCRVPRKLKFRYTRGKRIRVEVVQSNSETGYRHESYANYPVV